jgi:hypothetical protein
MPVALAAVVALGLSAGAMLTEAVVFVGYWRSLAPGDFLAWFRDNEPRLVSFFGPLQFASAGLAAVAAGLRGRRGGASAAWLAVAALLAVAAIALYPLYFRDANARFATATIAPAEVPAALARWARWQWVRTAVGVGASVAALLAVRRPAA